MEDLVGLTFGDADAAHLAHLTTRSHAQHEALGEFYDAVRSATALLAVAVPALAYAALWAYFRLRAR